MDRNFVRAYWRAARIATNNSPWLVAVILLAFSICIVLLLDGRPKTDTVAKITVETWLSVSGSLLASALFLLFQNLLASLQLVKNQLPLDYHKRIHDELGLKWIYPQRGASEIQQKYQAAINVARSRVWAIGMTNGSFIDQHIEILLARCRVVANLDVRIVFWNSDSTLSVMSNGSLSILEVQAQLEQKGPTGTDWKTKMQGQISQVENRLQAQKSMLSKVRIQKLSLVTNISCLIIDDEVFAFPFLGRSNSNLDPHMHFSATVGIGKLILEHYTAVLENKTFCHG